MKKIISVLANSLMFSMLFWAIPTVRGEEITLSAVVKSLGPAILAIQARSAGLFLTIGYKVVL
jgi:hypothetical protein